MKTDKLYLKSNLMVMLNDLGYSDTTLLENILSKSNANTNNSIYSILMNAKNIGLNKEHIALLLDYMISTLSCEDDYCKLYLLVELTCWVSVSRHAICEYKDAILNLQYNCCSLLKLYEDNKKDIVLFYSKLL